MKHVHHSKRHTADIKKIIIIPVVFCLVVYGILAAAVLPSNMRILKISNLFFSDHKKTFSDNYTNIFVPVDEQLTDVSSQYEGKVKTSVNISEIVFPNVGQQFGELVIDDCGVNCKLFFGTGKVALANGLGVYNGSSIPGYGKTILCNGYNTTYLNGLKNAKKDQIIKIHTSYGNYTYKITNTAVKEKNDKTAYDLSAKEEMLVIYTDYPFDGIGITNQNFFVYAEPVSGPAIDKNN